MLIYKSWLSKYGHMKWFEQRDWREQHKILRYIKHIIAFRVNFMPIDCLTWSTHRMKTVLALSISGSGPTATLWMWTSGRVSLTIDQGSSFLVKSQSHLIHTFSPDGWDERVALGSTPSSPVPGYLQWTLIRERFNNNIDKKLQKLEDTLVEQLLWGPLCPRYPF